jgi:murein DD-endopeptidase MepM/ murein hydrolase activator NlpD
VGVRSQPVRVADRILAAAGGGVETSVRRRPSREYGRTVSVHRPAEPAHFHSVARTGWPGLASGPDAGAVKVFLLVVALLAVLVAAPNDARADSPAPAVWPLSPPPTVVVRFDPPDTLWGPGHRGVDLLGFPGQTVSTAVAGTVTFAGTLAGRGVVVVGHGATRTTYEPVEPTVAVGTTLRAGETIGTLQSGLSHCFPRTCLHWGLLRGEEYLDPLSLLGFAPVRLLPIAVRSLLMPWGVLAGMPFAAALR